MKIEKGSRIGQLLDGTHQREMAAFLAKPDAFPPEQVAEAMRSVVDAAWEESDPGGFSHTHTTRSEAVRVQKGNVLK